MDGFPEHLALNHVALHVADLERSCQFFETVLGLRALPRPEFSFDGAWFRLGADQELHLICRPPHVPPPIDRDNHLALLCEDLDDWQRHFENLGVDFLSKKLRPDGAEQIFLQDPDGHYIELCTQPRHHG